MKLEGRDGEYVTPDKWQHSFELTLNEKTDWGQAYNAVYDIYEILKSEYHDKFVSIIFSIIKDCDGFFEIRFQTYIDGDLPDKTEKLLTRICVNHTLDVYILEKSQKGTWLEDEGDSDFGLLAYTPINEGYHGRTA